MRRRHLRERWLHARISGELEEALKREARRRRWPVSTVVRDVLESALDMVEDIVEDGLQIAHRSRRAGRPTRRSLDDVYGWQALILNRPAACGRCDAALGVGESAHRGLSDEPGPPVFLCNECVRRLRRPARDEESPR